MLQKAKSHKLPEKKKRPLPAPPQTMTAQINKDEVRQEVEDQFEVELCWCIQQLETCIITGKVVDKQVHEIAKHIHVLKSATAPLIKKRQTMRSALGDYRAKMAQDQNKYHKTVSSVKFTNNTPAKKSVFVRKACSQFIAEIPDSLKCNNSPDTLDNTVQKSSKPTFTFNFQ